MENKPPETPRDEQKPDEKELPEPSNQHQAPEQRMPSEPTTASIEPDFQNRIDMQPLLKDVDKIRAEIRKIIVGQEEMIDLLITAILADGHVLIEGVPGIAKTLAAKLISRTISVDFSRIQFTPDLMPADVLGTSVFNMKTSTFEFNRGPIFSNIILIDEINRAPAKTQSALFEVMEERQVTIDGQMYTMEAPFIVFATQNPIEQEGTYRLPEAQLDRFLFKIEVDYPNLADEKLILHEYHQRKTVIDPGIVKAVLSAKKLINYRRLIFQIHIDPALVDYIAEMVAQTRTHPALYLGASPRASLSILTGSKAIAAIRGRDFVTPEDIKDTIYPVLRHRIILMPEREMEGVSADDVIKQMIEAVEIPR